MSTTTCQFRDLSIPFTVCETVDGKRTRHIFLGKDETHFFYFTTEKGGLPQAPPLTVGETTSNRKPKGNIAVRILHEPKGNPARLQDAKYAKCDFPEAEEIEALRVKAIEYFKSRGKQSQSYKTGIGRRVIDETRSATKPLAV